MNEMTPPALPQGCGPALHTPYPARPLRQSIYERVRAAGAMSRAEVAKALEVSPASVTAGAGELIAAGFLREIDVPAREGTRGRPPVALGIRPEARRVAGIKLGDGHSSAALVDMGGAVLAEARLPSPVPPRRPETVVGMVEALVAELGAGADAVGIGLPGMIDHGSGRIAWSPVVEGRDVPLATLLSERLGVPVFIDNDANAVTLAELWFGAGRALTDFAVVTVENGLGMGLVIGNRLFRGGGGLGMELGHTKVHLDGALCRCGRRGCLEAYVADYALLREAATALAAPPSPDLLERLHAEARAGHPAATGIYRRAGRYLALGLANVAHLFDPARIILSGDRMRYEAPWAEEVLREMAAMTLPPGRAPVPVEIHTWGGGVWARGAAALALSEVTDRELGAGWSG